MAFTIDELDAPASHRLFNVNLNGTNIVVTLTETAAVVRRWIGTTNHFRRKFHGRLVVGLGVQWTLGGTNLPTDTLQLCMGCRCLVYQLSNSPNVPGSLRRFLMDSGNTFVGFWNHSDRWKLQISKHRLQMLRDPLDMRKYAQTDDGESLETATIERIVEEHLGIPGVPISREIRMSDWDDIYLSNEQVLQVTLDAHCVFDIGKNIRAWRLN
ncbi:hypothetical protein QN277_007408 [Acacia crassicarpa]|uniref:3'-5' exonuclease domain-containing protein n=1 Tax=Acacia crassicarpa TaxID=499986 RepID=A0AAE1IUI4_9FABA|nr:hypothetical protein QN277_007408 [Acacia crassicarpa]